jgi:hypothetical protein
MYEKMLHCVQKWGVEGKVPVNYVDMTTVEGLATGAFHDVGKVPSVLVENNGRIVARFDGGVADSRALESALRAANKMTNEGVRRRGGAPDLSGATGGV